MSASPREELVAAFLRFIEERGSGAYGALARARPPPPPPAMNLLCRKSRLDWRPHKEAEARQGAGKARDAASLRRHFRVGFMTMPASQERAPRPCAGGMAPRSLSCHAVGGGPASGDVAAGPGPGPSDRPAPAKPARHPGTRLSAPADPRRPEQPPGKKGAVAAAVAAGGIAEPRDGGRKVPPQKPARSPHTQLSAPFEEPPPPPPGTGAGAGGGGRTATSAAPPRPRAGPDPPPAAEEEEEEEDEEEPVYIEMVGDVCRGAEEAWDEGEAIYEEMKYPAAGEMPPLPLAPRGEGGPGAPQHRPPPALLLPTTTTTVPPPPLPGIPPPFPNLLQHRPPLLAFPPGKAHKAAAGTAAGTEPSKLPVPLHAKEAPAAATTVVTAMVTAAAAPPPGRARSHSTPLQPCAHAKAEAPGATAATAARPPPLPSLLPVPQPGRDKASLPVPPALAYAVVYQAVKVTAALPPAAEAALPPAAAAAARLPAAAARPEPPLGLLWTYPAASGGARRPPAYDSLRGSGRARGEDDAGGGWALPRKGPYGGRKGKEAEKAPEAARGWPGGGEAERDEAAAAAALAPSGIPLRAPGGRTGLPVPCQTFPACHRNGDFPGGYRLGRSASTSGVRQAARPRESAAPPRGPPWGAPRGAVAAAAIAAAEPPPAAAAAAAGAAAAARERDGKLLEVIERKRCVCKEIKARHRPERGLCKQESMPILPSWRRGAEARKAGTPPCRRQHTVLWDTAI